MLEEITVNDFKPRDYQEIILDAVENEDYHKILFCLPRRSGKDFLAWNIAIDQCLKKPCLVLYALPTYSQARKCIWDAISIDGKKFIEMINPKLIDNINQSEMKIRFINGSLLRLIGADAYDTSLVGTNAQMIILSEAALMNLEQVFGYARPILACNDGKILIFSTPRGKNAFYRLYETAKKLDDWFVLKMGVDETKHISEQALADERAQVSQDLFDQEWNCSFSKGVEGQIFGRELERARLEERVGFFPHQPQLLTHLAIDIGVSDATTILWFQVPNEQGAITIIDSYSNNNVGVDHYAKIIQDKPYRMGKYFAPHDLAVREWGGGAVTRYEKARELGLDFEILEQIDVQDGIDNVKAHFPRICINEAKCKKFLDALENYRREFDEVHQVYKPKPLHTWAADWADCLRYLCQSIHKTARGMTPDEFNRIRARNLYGSSNPMDMFARGQGR